MRRRAEFLVCKRDGRREWLRATKLARSIAAALRCPAAERDGPVEVGAEALALELAAVVLEALRRRQQLRPRAAAGAARDAAEPPCLTTVELATAVERTLWVSGRAEAAVRYARVRAARAGRCGERPDRAAPDLAPARGGAAAASGGAAVALGRSAAAEPDAPGGHAAGLLDLARWGLRPRGRFEQN